jgi:trehalose 6-phosphate synthase/phosphatase
VPAELEGRVGVLLLQLEECCRDGAWAENKGITLTYHYRNVPLEKREPLVSKAHQLITEAGFQIGNAHCALESKAPVAWDKGRASIYILRTAFGADWSDRIRIIYVGDDATDEDAMSALKGMAFTFRVASSSLTQTVADKRLPSTDSVACLLRWVEGHMAARGHQPRGQGAQQPSGQRCAAAMSSDDP